MKKILIISMLLLMVSTLVFGAEAIDQPRYLGKTGVTSDIWINANRMNGVMRNNGTWFYDNILGDWGLEWPQGSGLSPIFGAGQWIGAMVDGVPRVAGIQHSATEFMPGMILSPGVADNRNDPKYRWYELRSDGTGDWSNWPTDQGAPVDADGNPMMIGDQTAWCVYNDLADHTEYATAKLGAEVRQMAWAFNRADAIGDMIFIKWQIANKSDKDWADTYFSIWSDPDLGDANDDFVGCDSLLGLGMCYNSTDADQNYGSAPPALGIDFFQGPIVPEAGSTVSLPDGTVLDDFTMLKMTSFVYYNNNDSPQGNPQSGGDVWNFFRGIWRDGTFITNDGGNGIDQSYPATTFMFPGDPESDTGWLDQNPDDRRFLMTTGPFTMPMWDDENGNNLPDFGETGVQEIVCGIILAKGSNNLNSVTVLKAVDEIAQLAYDINFVLPPAPAQPVVKSSELDGHVILTWDQRSEYMPDGISLYDVEDLVANGLVGQKIVVGYDYVDVTDGTFNFSEYVVWQFTDGSGSDPVEYARYGVADPADAVAYTGPRFAILRTNKNSKVGNVGDPLANGKEYYFGVQAYSYCKFARPQTLPSPITKVKVTPQQHPGVRYNSSEGDTLEVGYVPVNAGIPAGDGGVTAIVVDPAEVTGHDYGVKFKDDGEGNIIWDLWDMTTNTVVLADQVNQENDDAYTVVDGLLVKVAGPLPGIKSIVEIDPATGAVYDTRLMGSLNNYGRSQHWPVFVISESAGTDYARMDRFGLMTPKDYEIIFTDTDSTLVWDYYTDLVLVDSNGKPAFVPATFWRIDPDGTRMRITVCVLDAAGDGIWNRNPDGIYGPAFDMFYIYDNAEYKPADVATYISTNDGTVAPGYGPYGVVYPAINRFMINMYIDLDGYAAAGDLDADGYFYGPPHAGEWMRLNTYKPNTTNDVFTFTAPAAVTSTNEDLKADMENIRVVPNPYYGYHSGEANIFERWVQFTNVPPKCTIRIFDLAGNPIRKLEKDDTYTLLKWDLENEYEIPVASGIYIFHIEVPDVGEKVGKIAVFAPNERLDTY